MDIWLTVVLTLHVLVAISIIFLVLLQHGKGADMGAAFGSGSSGSLFGATGSANFLSRTTAVLAAVFFLTSLGLAYLATHRPQTSGGSVMQGVTAPPAPAPRPAGDVPQPTDVPKPALPKANDLPK
ncbi:MAG: preprotein translocase subunit SecG [Burkholderiales bacterium]